MRTECSNCNDVYCAVELYQDKDNTYSFCPFIKEEIIRSKYPLTEVKIK